ncbi:MAG: oxygenase MpaB family protein [Sandaracinaceae bacterium]
MRPTEFRYRERRDHRTARRLRRIARALGFDPEPSEETLRAFEGAYFNGDPVAERFVRAAMTTGGLHAAQKELDGALGALARGEAALDVRPELAALLDDVTARPDWLDDDRVALGARAFRRYGSAVFRFAGAITLAGYLESSVAKPLALSGAYVGDGTRERFLETASFWIEVSEPDGLDVVAPGFAAAMRVRVLHAMVRVRLEHHREWKIDAWGVPINEGDALLTQLGGSLAPGIGMRLLGFRPTRREIEAMLHFWRYVGHLMGSRFSHFPETIEDALRISWVASFKGSRTAGEDGRALCRSYAAAFTPEPGDLLAQLEHGLHRGMTQLFLPAAIYRAQGLPPAGLWTLLPLAMFPFVFTAETLRRRLPALEGIADAIARRERRAWLARHTRGAKPAYRSRESLTR